MMCLTTKKKFDVVNPEIVVLRNGRYAYKAECPWKGKNEKTLYAFKFCSRDCYERSVSNEPEKEELEDEEPEIA